MFPLDLIIVRHTESQANALARALDQDPTNAELTAKLASKPDADWPATEEGLLRASWTGELFPTLFSFDRKSPQCYSGPHTRQTQSAAALSKSWIRSAALWQSSDAENEKPRWIIDPNLAERSWGSQSLSRRQFELQMPEESKKHRRDPLGYQPPYPGAESIMTVRNFRVERFIRRLERECRENDTVIAVTSHDWMMACRSLLENLDPYTFREMYEDPRQRIQNLDVLWYSRKDMHLDGRISAEYPVSVSLIHLPFEETPIDDVEPIIWRPITRKDYAREELLNFQYEPLNKRPDAELSASGLFKSVRRQSCVVRRSTSRRTTHDVRATLCLQTSFQLSNVSTPLQKHEKDAAYYERR